MVNEYKGDLEKLSWYHCESQETMLYKFILFFYSLANMALGVWLNDLSSISPLNEPDLPT